MEAYKGVSTLAQYLGLRKSHFNTANPSSEIPFH